MENITLLKTIEFLSPADLNYQEWINVGMALKHEGYTANVWDDWSKRDLARYHPGECFKKWMTFEGGVSPITGGTIVQMAKDRGWAVGNKDQGRALDWDDTISADLVVVDPEWLEEQEIFEPADQDWNPVQDLIKYLEVLFDSTENVGYVTETWKKDNKYMPTKGSWDRTAGQLIEELSRCHGDIGAVIGDYNPQVGAWIRFNPLDGQGIKNENVTDFRYALVESDDLALERQNAIIRELELPVACLVYSGKKSLHAIVKIEAANYNEYRQRVNYLYDVCKNNGLSVDTQNRNPSRLSRMPGVTREGKKQFLIDTNMGKPDWDSWYDWIEGVNDDLPDPEPLSATWDHLPPLAPPLIKGILRQGHKMLLSGPSKAGKSYTLIQLCRAIADGDEWLGWPCAQGRVLYVNLELDRASCLHRFKDVYNALGLPPDNIQNIDIWNLRGKSVPMDKLAPKLIRRAQKRDYIAVVIDPIYKVITGDENSASDMANFTNQFDKVATELGCAVIYCHHHSKGYQGGKRSMDRASGSGVFARDPDALLDMTELTVDDDIRKAQIDRKVGRAIADVIKSVDRAYYGELCMDDLLSPGIMMQHAQRVMTGQQLQEMMAALNDIRREGKHMTAWRIEGTLREFAGFAPINAWFDYPLHRLDRTGALEDLEPEAEKAPWQKAMEKRKDPEQKAEERKRALEVAFDACNMDGNVTVGDLADYMDVTKNTVWNRIKEHGGFKKISQPGKETVVVPIE